MRSACVFDCHTKGAECNGNALRACGECVDVTMAAGNVRACGHHGDDGASVQPNTPPKLPLFAPAPFCPGLLRSQVGATLTAAQCVCFTLMMPNRTLPFPDCTAGAITGDMLFASLNTEYSATNHPSSLNTDAARRAPAPKTIRSQHKSLHC